jgi:tRNA-uridine 2-sulfurtransferase
MCNQEIKFKLFLQAALDDGADMIATGHYARVKDGKLLTARDGAKDQTYFLYRVTEEALSKTLFPVGDFTKPEIRNLAGDFGLVTATKKDSQGICFVGEIGIKDFLSQYVKGKPGDIIDRKTNKVIGQHEGAIFYTIGQRHGLGVGGGLPYYVVGKDMKKNIIYVTTDLNDKVLWQNKVKIDQLHWINGDPDLGKKYKARMRYRANVVGCSIKIRGGKATIMLDEPERAIAVGQSVVLYDRSRVIGGGIIC